MAETASSGTGSVELGKEETMAKVARRGRRRKRNPAADPVLPDEIILWEILARVPAKELVRYRAVCRSWRRVTSEAAFLLVHHQHQPSLPLVEFEADGNIAHNTVDALDLRRSGAVRRPVLGFDKHKRYPRGYIYIIEASCDSLLLLSFSNHPRLYLLRLYLCNPATRQWLALPDLIGNGDFTALYPHRPSGEYRVLYWKGSNMGAVYYVLTVGSSEEQERCIGLPLASPSMKNHTTCWHLHGVYRPVLLHDCLYWYIDSKIVIFDTVAESFRWMQPPTATSEARVLQMDGTLGITHVDLHAMTVEAWALLDREKEIWSSKFRIKLPYKETRKDANCVDFLDGAVMSENGDMLLISDNSLFHFDSKGKLHEKFILENVEPTVSGLYFKESLVRHAFFERKDNGRRARMPRCFRGLY